MFVHNRLTMLGTREVLEQVAASDWLTQLKGQHAEIYEANSTRRTWWFDTQRMVTPKLVILSKRWPAAIFLLDYEQEQGRTKGMAKVIKGRLELCKLVY